MPRPATQLRLPQPCHQSWDAMVPTGPGRHCAACQKVVVDFTQHTDAQILAFFRAGANRNACGHFRSDQLNRPLLPPAAPPSWRWRAWLALALAAWSPRLVGATPAPPTTQSAPRHRAQPKRRPSTLAVKHIQGTVHDATTHAALAGVAVFLKGENRMVLTDAAGRFRLQLPARRPRGGRTLLLHFVGYESKALRLPASTKAGSRLELALSPDPAAAGVQVVGYQTERRYSVTGGAPMLVVGPEERLPQLPAATHHARPIRQWLKALFKK